MSGGRPFVPVCAAASDEVAASRRTTASDLSVMVSSPVMKALRRESVYALAASAGGPGAASPDVEKNLPARRLVRGGETGPRPNRHRVRRLNQESERVPLRRT